MRTRLSTRTQHPSDHSHQPIMTTALKIASGAAGPFQASPAGASVTESPPASPSPRAQRATLGARADVSRGVRVLVVPRACLVARRAVRAARRRAPLPSAANKRQRWRGLPGAPPHLRAGDLARRALAALRDRDSLPRGVHRPPARSERPSARAHSTRLRAQLASARGAARAAPSGGIRRARRPPQAPPVAWRGAGMARRSARGVARAAGRAESILSVRQVAP